MTFLAKKTSKALKDGESDSVKRFLQYQKDFQEKHLMKWLPRMCNDVLEIGRTDFYKGVAMITKGFLPMDHLIVEDLDSLHTHHNNLIKHLTLMPLLYSRSSKKACSSSTCSFRKLAAVL